MAEIENVELAAYAQKWNRNLDEFVASVRSELLPLDESGEGGAIADIAKHLYEKTQNAPDPGPIIATYAATAILRLAQQRDKAA